MHAKRITKAVDPSKMRRVLNEEDLGPVFDLIAVDVMPERQKRVKSTLKSILHQSNYYLMHFWLDIPTICAYLKTEYQI